MMRASHRHIDVVLQPGEFFVGDQRYVIRTLLGSCVSITLWHPVYRIGAMSHFLLPARSGLPASQPDGRYGDEALTLMLHELAQRNVLPSECRAKIFGGGKMFPGQIHAGQEGIGRKNGEAARDMLRARGIGIVSENLFGIGHRQIIFNVQTGDVWARQANPVDIA